MVSDFSIYSLHIHFIPVNCQCTSKLKEKIIKEKKMVFGRFTFWSFSRVWLLVFCILPSKTTFKFLVLHIHFMYFHSRIRITCLDLLPNLAKYLMSWPMEPDKPGFQAQLHYLQREIPQSSATMSLSHSLVKCVLSHLIASQSVK